MSPSPHSEPPRWARALVIAFAPRRERAALDGDLTERFRRRVVDGGFRRAQRWYATQTVRSLVPLGLASFGELSLGRWIAGALVGIALTSVAPAFVDAFFRPEALTGAGIVVWYAILAGGAALTGGYAASRLARVNAAGPLLGLVWILYMPAVLHVIGAGAQAAELGWLGLMLASATAGGAFSAHLQLPG